MMGTIRTFDAGEREIAVVDLRVLPLAAFDDWEAADDAVGDLVVAGLAASGRTEISRIYHLERGYENLVDKLNGLGARVWKENE